VGNLDLMTQVPAGRAPTQEPVAVSPTVAASTAMGVLVASGLARGSLPIIANESEGIEGDERPRRAPRPVQEPPEVLRLSTLQLAVVIFRRGKAALRDRLGTLVFWRRR
jgi:hypothetical protein